MAKASKKKAPAPQQKKKSGAKPAAKAAGKKPVAKKSAARPAAKSAPKKSTAKKPAAKSSSKKSTKAAPKKSGKSAAGTRAKAAAPKGKAASKKAGVSKKSVVAKKSAPAVKAVKRMPAKAAGVASKAVPRAQVAVTRAKLSPAGLAARRAATVSTKQIAKVASKATQAAKKFAGQIFSKTSTKSKSVQSGTKRDNVKPSTSGGARRTTEGSGRADLMTTKAKATAAGEGRSQGRRTSAPTTATSRGEGNGQPAEDTVEPQAPPMKKSKLKADDLRRLRAALEQERSRLIDDIRALDEQALTSNVLSETLEQQPGFSLQLADSASDNQQIDTALGIRSIEADQLAQIDEALRAIETGEYGVCMRCGEPIAMERLLVKPMAKYCVPCRHLMETGKA